MDPENGFGFFDRVTLKGRNVGAAMTIRHGATTGEHQDACCINIYVNNNIQGVNNSMLLESEVKMRDPGVSIFLEDFNIGKGKKWTKSNKKRRQEKDTFASKLWFPGIFIAFIILLFLLLTIS